MTPTTTIWPYFKEVVTTTTASTSVIWTNWCDCEALDTSTIWTGWARERIHIIDSYAVGNTIRQPTEVEVQQNLRDREIYNQQRLQVEGEKAAARDRAMVLLQGHLDDIQRHDLANKGFFDLDVISQDGSRKKYRINRKWSQNIQQIDPNGRVLETLCIHPRMQVPVEDSMLTQKLMLESGLEQELLRIANHF